MAALRRYALTGAQRRDYGRYPSALSATHSNSRLRDDIVFRVRRKRPATPHGFLDASADPVVLRELWTKYAGPLVGVRTGCSSGIDVLDLDRKHREATGVVERSHRDCLPITRVHRTRSGGLHLVLPPSARHAMLDRPARVPGIDGRGDGGYVIWWPASLDCPC